MKEMKAILDYIINNNLIILMLALDTIRAFVAATGIVSREIPLLSRIIYGKRDEDIIKEVLKDLGYGKREIEKYSKRLKREVEAKNMFPKKDTIRHLTYILAKNTVEFQDEISYGLIAPDKMTSYSKYYINTMDAVHNEKDLEELSTIMIRLMESTLKRTEIDFIIVPKGGNPLLAQNIARKLNINLIIAKDQNDSARPPQNAEEEKIFNIRYEGIKELLSKGKDKKYKGVLIDCNTSGGTQLINIVKEFNNFIDNCNGPIEHITKAYVLFKLVKYDSNNNEIKIEKKFEDVNCALYRIYDIDEDDKKDLMQLSSKEYYESIDSIDGIHDKIKNKKRYYYKG